MRYYRLVRYVRPVYPALVSKCEHLPAPGTVRSEGSLEPASLMDAGTYPVRAVCKLCGLTIRLDHFYRPYWDAVDGPCTSASG